MKNYEARLSVETRNKKTGNWSEKQVYQAEPIDSASEACLIANELFADPDQAIRDATADVFREAKKMPDYSEMDILWTLEIIEINDGGAEKFLADCSEWESRLAKEWFNN